MNLCPYSDDAKKVPLPDTFLILVSETDATVTLRTWRVCTETDKAYRITFKVTGWGFESWVPKLLCKLHIEAKTIEIQKWWASKNLIKWRKNNDDNRRG